MFCVLDRCKRVNSERFKCSSSLTLYMLGQNRKVIPLVSCMLPLVLLLDISGKRESSFLLVPAEHRDETTLACLLIHWVRGSSIWRFEMLFRWHHQDAWISSLQNFPGYAGKTYQQTVSILIGTYCAPLLADIFLYSYKSVSALSGKETMDILV